MDKQVSDIIAREAERQNDTIELLASENHVSQAVSKAVGSCLTNKYAEGYPGKRYYCGCKNYDEMEILAQERARSCLTAVLLMFNRILVHQLIYLHFLLSCSQETNMQVLFCQTVAI